MSLALFALALVAAESASGGAVTMPPPELLFGYFRMKSFRERTDDLHCNGSDKHAADAEMDAIRNRLIKRYGAKAFSPPRGQPSGPGDCRVVMQVYGVNLAEYRRLVDATLTKSAAETRGHE